VPPEGLITHLALQGSEPHRSEVDVQRVRHPLAATLLAALSTVLATGGAAVWALTGPEGAVHAAAAPAAVPASPAGLPGTAPPCGDEPVDAAGWQALLESDHDQWSGGDGASSTRLPDGRLLWVFGDSFAGAVRADGSRAAGTRLARNAVVVTEGGCLTSLAPGSDALPGADGTWLWPTHAVVVDGADPARVVVLAQRVGRDPSDALGFERRGTALAVLEVPWGAMPELVSITDLPGSATLWGAGLAVDGATTWIYGTRASTSAAGRDLLLARAPTATLDRVETWRYRTEHGWSARASHAAVVLPGSVSTVPSARASHGRTLIVTKPGEFLDPRVVALTAPTPWGPWSSRVLLEDPSTAARLAYSPALVDVLPGRDDVVLVNHTSTDLSALQAQGHLADPGFHDVGRLPGR
jgi:hypothetical protein